MTKCEACSEESIERVLVRNALAYWCCQKCGHCKIDLPNDEIITGFNDSQKNYFGVDSYLLNATPTIFDNEILEKRRVQVREFIPNCSWVLEVGPGSGFFAEAIKAMGHSVELVEHSPTLAEKLSRCLAVPLHIGEFEQLQLPQENFDVFCSFHVIEHVKDPLVHLRAGFLMVKPGGIGLIATPNSCSWQQRLFRLFSPNFDSSHLRVFSKTSLKSYAELAGWSVEIIRTPEYTISWLRVISKALRKFRGEDEEVTAGKYSVTLSQLSIVYILASILSWPIRRLQELSGGGNEIFIVLRRPERKIEY